MSDEEEGEPPKIAITETAVVEGNYVRYPGTMIYAPRGEDGPVWVSHDGGVNWERVWASA